MIKQNILMMDLILNTILFAYDQVIVASMEGKIQTAVYVLNSIVKKYSLKISVNKTR
jgi:hypothetical protein